MRVIDSHTGGEPTRVILDGFPDLGAGPLADRAARLAGPHRDAYRAVVLEPRGQVAMVGALLVPPTDPGCVTGVIFFDVAAVLGMCGHGTIGVAVTLVRLGRIGIGRHRIETPAGIVTVEVHDPATVTVTNIESRRSAAGVAVDVPGLGRLTGDVAYGGNWFYLVEDSPLPVEPANIPRLTEAAIATRSALAQAGITGDDGAAIDHVIFYGPAGEGASHGELTAPERSQAGRRHAELRQAHLRQAGPGETGSAEAGASRGRAPQAGTAHGGSAQPGSRAAAWAVSGPAPSPSAPGSAGQPGMDQSGAGRSGPDQPGAGQPGDGQSIPPRMGLSGEVPSSRNFVLCPDDAYDRSPCGTGCSARLACLAADGRLAEGVEIVQHSIIGSTYRLSWHRGGAGGVIPSITGRAYVMAEATLIFDPADPFRTGIAL
ncbi:proline racemase family protein [Mesobaculum littorinae]|uniref:proline racemase family protein n=1 Tax=Mesobaculum littorinae TaxID=2486419 RepID=UPI0026B4500E